MSREQFSEEGEIGSWACRKGGSLLSLIRTPHCRINRMEEGAAGEVLEASDCRCFPGCSGPPLQLKCLLFRWEGWGLGPAHLLEELCALGCLSRPVPVLWREEAGLTVFAHSSWKESKAHRAFFCFNA